MLILLHGGSMKKVYRSLIAAGATAFLGVCLIPMFFSLWRKDRQDIRTYEQRQREAKLWWKP